MELYLFAGLVYLIRCSASSIAAHQLKIRREVLRT
jgi:hypothetical protein